MFGCHAVVALGEVTYFWQELLIIAWLCWSEDALVTRGANDTCLVTWVQITQRGEQGGGRLPLPQLYDTQLAVDLGVSYSWLPRY